jgi:hypothetical protein
MDCERFDKTTMELLYGELDEISEAAALRHLHHCTRCREIWGHLKTTKELSDVPMEDSPSDLFDSILTAEKRARQSLTTGERFSRAISVAAGYAMRPQVAMAAILLLVIGSSLMFIPMGPTDGGQISVTELGTPHTEAPLEGRSTEAMVFEKVASAPLAEPSEAEQDELDDRESEKKVNDLEGQRRAYSEAMSAYQDGRYAEAERLFSEVASGGGQQAASAALHEGHAARNGSGCARAATLYDAISAQYSGSTVGSEASWHAASCYRAMGQLRRASAHYEALRKQSAYRDRAEQALSELEGPAIIASKAASSTSKPSATNDSSPVPQSKEASPPPSAAAGEKETEITPPASVPEPSPKSEGTTPKEAPDPSPAP